MKIEGEVIPFPGADDKPSWLSKLEMRSRVTFLQKKRRGGGQEPKDSHHIINHSDLLAEPEQGYGHPVTPGFDPHAGLNTNAASAEDVAHGANVSATVTRGSRISG